jgi:hypothetical protein
VIFDALLAALFALLLLGNISELERPASDANGNDLLINFLSTGPTAALTFCPSLPPADPSAQRCYSVKYPLKHR